MSELTSYYYYEDRVITPATHQYRVYHADEADKVIAEKDKEIAELKEQIEVLKHQACKMDCMTVKLYNEACDDIIHQKYKRCLAMARWCDAQVEWYNSLNEYYSFWLELYVKWHNRWLELAERFKEAK